MNIAVHELQVKCAVSNCTNQAGEGKMLKLAWPRVVTHKTYSENELILCAACYGTLIIALGLEGVQL